MSSKYCKSSDRKELIVEWDDFWKDSSRFFYSRRFTPSIYFKTAFRNLLTMAKWYR